VSETTILAGDIGGTNCRLALYRVSGGASSLTRTQTYPSRGAPNLEGLVRRFLEEGPPVSVARAALAVAGPVIDGRCVATNLPWILEEGALAEAAHTARLRLLNDLEAMAFGVLFAPADKLVSLNGLSPGRGNAAVIAAGTGLGEAYLHWDGERHRPSPSEGSHGEFGPRNALQLELARYLIEKHGHPSTERIVSGPGFSLLFDFLVETGRAKPSAELQAALSDGDRNAIISRRGVDGADPVCAQVMDLFVDCFGAEAGNMALRGFATGGVYVGGGIAPKILPRLRDGKFTAAFEDKGRFREFMKKVPLTAVLEEDAGLIGAANFARMMA
jgi:glucokinase